MRGDLIREPLVSANISRRSVRGLGRSTDPGKLHRARAVSSMEQADDGARWSQATTLPRGAGRRGDHPRRPRAPVMSDVGRLAGVSHQTVSRVINGSPHVRPETRSRVLAAMAELGYRPNSVARALVTGPLEHARRGQLRHDALRARVDAVRDRARRPRGRLLHHRRQPEGAGPPVGVRRGRAPAPAGRRRDPRDRAAAGGRPMRSCTRRADVPAGGGRGRARAGASRWSRSISSRAP